MEERGGRRDVFDLADVVWKDKEAVAHRATLSMNEMSITYETLLIEEERVAVMAWHMRREMLVSKAGQRFEKVVARRRRTHQPMMLLHSSRTCFLW